MVSELYEAFPKDGSGFFCRDTFREKKRTSASLSDYDEVLANCTYGFQSAEVVNLISELTGIEGLEPDPALYAGGLSMMFEGDFLNPHIDNSHDAKRDRYRRLNLLYYVSPDWTPESGGNFELWNDDRSAAKTIVSGENRLVVMETTKTSWHSVNQVRVDRSRCCISNYFFSKHSPEERDYFHVTSFDGRPEEPVRRVLGRLDNVARSVAAKALGIGRGKGRVNKAPPKA